MTVLVAQQVAAGLATGSIYALLALALVLVHRTTGVVNFAQGAMGTLAAYVAWSFSAWLSPWVALAAAAAAAFLLGAAVERVLIRPVHGREPLVVVIVTVALLICLEGLVSLVWGDSLRAFPPLFPPGVVTVAGVRVPVGALGTLALLLGILLTLHLALARTRVGLAMRAVATDAGSSALLGLRVGRLLMVGWGLAASLGAVAAVLSAPTLYLQPTMMDTVLLYALAAAILGGLDSPLGAVLAALGIGVVENLAGSYVPGIGSDLKIGVPLAVLAVVLLLRPHGLLGRPETVRV